MSHDWEPIDGDTLARDHPAAFMGWAHRTRHARLLLLWFLKEDEPITGHAPAGYWQWRLCDGHWRDEFSDPVITMTPFAWAEHRMAVNLTRDAG